MSVNVLSYTSTNVTTSAYTTLVASADTSYGRIEILDTSGKILKIAIGAEGSEIDICSVAVSGTIVIPYFIAAGSRISIKAIDASATSGYNVLSLIP